MSSGAELEELLNGSPGFGSDFLYSLCFSSLYCRRTAPSAPPFSCIASASALSISALLYLRLTVSSCPPPDKYLTWFRFSEAGQFYPSYLYSSTDNPQLTNVLHGGACTAGSCSVSERSACREMLADPLVDLIWFWEILADLTRILFFVCRFKKTICKHRSKKGVPKQQRTHQFNNKLQKLDQQSIKIEPRSIRSPPKSIQKSI